MRRCRLPRPTLALAGLLLAASSAPLHAQPATATTQHSVVSYDRAHEIRVTGNIEEVVSRPAPGSPMGLHVLVAGATGRVDAHLGPYLSKDAQETLHTGTPVEIVGAMETVHGKQWLLARQVNVGGRTITVRSQSGLLVRPASHAHRAADKSSSAELNGGAR